MTTGVQKELNLLLTNPQVPELSDDSDVCKPKSVTEDHIPYIDAADLEAGEKRINMDSSDEERMGDLNDPVTLVEASPLTFSQISRQVRKFYLEILLKLQI